MEITNELRSFAKNILERGPARVMIDTDEAMNPERARSQGYASPDIVFIRRDGWSLGAPNHLAGHAERLWQDSWIGVLIKPEEEPRPYADWAVSR